MCLCYNVHCLCISGLISFNGIFCQNHLSVCRSVCQTRKLWMKKTSPEWKREEEKRLKDRENYEMNNFSMEIKSQVDNKTEKWIKLSINESCILFHAVEVIVVCKITMDVVFPILVKEACELTVNWKSFYFLLRAFPGQANWVWGVQAAMWNNQKTFRWGTISPSSMSTDTCLRVTDQR